MGSCRWRLKGYYHLFACPVCDRSRRDLYPYTSYRRAKKWEGKYTTYTEVEMFERKQNRRDVIDSLRRGALKNLNLP